MTALSHISVCAGKQHVCEWCGGTILVGEFYIRRVGKWQGDFYNRAFHGVCDNALAAAVAAECALGNYEGYSFDSHTHMKGLITIKGESE